MDWTKAFLTTLRKSGNVSQSARSAKIARRTAYARREIDEEFKAAWDEAIEEATDDLEEEARKRAIKTSDTLLIFLLKANRPGKYRETIRQEHTGNVTLTWESIMVNTTNDDDSNSFA